MPPDSRARAWTLAGQAPGTLLPSAVIGPRIKRGETVTVVERNVLVSEIVEWMRGDEAEQVRIEAAARGVAPEDALAHWVESKYGGESDG